MTTARCNLRLATSLTEHDEPSSCRGQFSQRHRGKWNPYIQVNGKQTSLGLFNNYDDAKQARQRAEETYFGDYKHTTHLKLSYDYIVTTADGEFRGSQGSPVPASLRRHRPS